MTKDSFSPAAAAVLDACNDAVERLPLSSPPEQFSITLIAAALEAAADQVAPRTPEPAGSKPTAAWHRWNVTGALRLNLLAIAAELEAL